MLAAAAVSLISLALFLHEPASSSSTLHSNGIKGETMVAVYIPPSSRCARCL